MTFPKSAASWVQAILMAQQHTSDDGVPGSKEQ